MVIKHGDIKQENRQIYELVNGAVKKDIIKYLEINVRETDVHELHQHEQVYFHEKFIHHDTKINHGHM